LTLEVKPLSQTRECVHLKEQPECLCSESRDTEFKPECVDVANIISEGGAIKVELDIITCISYPWEEPALI
jgi:hypothetical protein